MSTSDKMTTLAQLQSAALMGLQAAGAVAQAAAEAIEEVLDVVKADKAEATAITIPATGWNKGTDAAYPYYCDIVVEGITANDRAEITIAPGSLDKAKACGLCPTNETLAGKIRVHSIYIPEAAIAAEYWIEDGKE